MSKQTDSARKPVDASTISGRRDQTVSQNGPSMQIGVVAERTGLSLRTIRFYEEEGLITPSTRTDGGFRLYTETDCSRLQLIKQMKPLGFSLDQMRDLLHVLDRLAAHTQGPARRGLIERLDEFAATVDERREKLREELASAARFADMLRRRSKRESSTGAEG